MTFKSKTSKKFYSFFFQTSLLLLFSQNHSHLIYYCIKIAKKKNKKPPRIEKPTKCSLFIIAHQKAIFFCLLVKSQTIINNKLLKKNRMKPIHKEINENKTKGDHVINKTFSNIDKNND
jgi:hypothetical protein